MAEGSPDVPAPSPETHDEGAESHASSRRLLNATAIMASGTLVSRVLGFVRALLLVFVLGSSTAQADAFNTATLVPNTLYMILAGGALNTVLVPQIIRHTKHDDDGGIAFINRIVTAFLVLLATATVIATLLTPQVLTQYTSDAWRQPAMADNWHSLVLLGFLTMPQIFFYGVFFLLGQVLNAHDRFGPMMWAPIVNNVVGVAVLGGYAVMWGTNLGHPLTDTQVLVLGVGSTLGIVAQTAALLPALRAIGFRYRPRWDLKGQGLGETFHLSKWMLGYVVLTTIVQALVVNLASGATAVDASGNAVDGAGVTTYNTAYLVWILPHSLLTVSLATAMLPSASRLASAGDLPGVAAETSRTLRLALTFLVPASLGFLVLGLPFSRITLSHGAGEQGWMFVGWTIMAFAVGLIPYTIQYLYLRGYYALDNTRVPFFLQLLISIVNIVLALALAWSFQDPTTLAPRLALAYSGSYIVGAVATHYALRRRLPGLSGRSLLSHVTRVTVATLPGAVIAVGITWATLASDSLIVVLIGFVASVVVILGGFFFVAKRLGIREATQLMALVRRRQAAEEAGQVPVDPVELAAEGAIPPTSWPAADEGPLLEYPDPDRPAAPAASTPPDGRTTPGQILDGRYQLIERLHQRGDTLLWLGYDLTLSRSVLIHLLHPDEPRTLDLLDQARQAAPAVDARFLRVWDAVLVEDELHGSYIVCEYVPARTLQLALQDGAFTDIESAWIIRELAAALSTVHARGLHHRQLSPNNVVITEKGDLKIVGFLLENAFRSTVSDARDGESVDVIALGRLLYALTTGFWAGSERYGLAAAPTDLHGRPLQPRQISTHMSVELSTVVDRILSRTPRDGASRLTTTQAITEALDVLLQGQSAAPLLAERVDLGSGGVPRIWTEPATPSDPGGEETTGWVEEPGTSTSLRVNADADPVLPRGHASAPELEPVEESTQSFVATSPDEPTPIPPPTTAPRSSADPSRRWTLGLFVVFLVALGVGLSMVFVDAFQRRTTPVTEVSYSIVAVDDFDPSDDGGDATENPKKAKLAVDGDLATAWTTENYGKSADFNGRKPGAGLLVDLGQPEEVRRVSLVLGDGLTSGEIRVPRETTVTEAPYTSVDDWQRVATFGPASGEVTVQLTEPVTTRFVLVYLTSMPKSGPNYVGSIHEIQVGG